MLLTRQCTTRHLLSPPERPQNIHVIKATYSGARMWIPARSVNFSVINTDSPPPFSDEAPRNSATGLTKTAGARFHAPLSLFTVGRWWLFLWQVSVPLRANKSPRTGPLAPWRGVCLKVMIVTSPPHPYARSRAPNDGERSGQTAFKKTKTRITSRRPDAPRFGYKMKLRARLPHWQVLRESLRTYAPKEGRRG